MKLKIDTKEKFTVLTPEEPFLTANMTDDIEKLSDYVLLPKPHLIINLKFVTGIDDTAAASLTRLQQGFYEKNISFVICEMEAEVEEVFEKLDLIDSMNVTPTESEAWDIVQMEEIERDLLNDFDEENK